MALIPIAVLCLGIGLYPKPLLDQTQPDVRALVRVIDEADLKRRDRQALDEMRLLERNP